MQDNSRYDDSGPSKSQKKRDMQALQSLGEALIKLSAERLAKIDMPESLRDAVLDAHRIQSRSEAMRRQMQYIGRLMRDTDPAPIRAALDALNGTSRAETARMHRLESLRERFLENEQVASEIAKQYPDADLQHLRQLRRNALRDKEQNRPPRAFREIFQILRELDTTGRSAEEVSADEMGEGNEMGEGDE